METFDNLSGADEPLYHEWRRRNPDGFVVNTPRTITPSYFVVHRPSCWLITRAPRSKSDKPFTGETYIKLCATDPVDLMREARRRGRVDPLQYCGNCKPDSGNPFLKELEDSRAYSDYFDGDSLTRASRLARERGCETPAKLTRETTEFVREQAVSDYAKLAAKGVCTLCCEPTDLDPMSFLDCHHIVFLRDGGPDTRENVVGVCPNCHRRLHIAPDARTVERLAATARKRAAELDEA